MRIYEECGGDSHNGDVASSGGADPLEKDDLEEASEGEKLVSLLMDSPSWVHRRVDALRLGGDGKTRLHVSLDVTIPVDLCLKRPGGQRVAVPLAFMEKVPLRSLDTEDWTEKPASVLESSVNADYAHQFLLALTPSWVQNDEIAWKPVQKLLGQLVASEGIETPKDIEGTFKQLLTNAQGRREALTEDELYELDVFTEIALKLSQQFLFMVEIDAERVGTRSILKYSLDQDAPRISWDPTKRAIFKLEVPDFGFAASQHMEVELPDGIVLERLTLRETRFLAEPGKGTADDVPERRTQRPSGHVTLRPSARLSSGELVVSAVPSKQGLYRFAKISIMLVMLAVLAAWFIRSDTEFFVRKVEIPSPSASILLIGPALLLSWFSRTPEHTLVAKVQGPLRLGLLASALVLLIMAILAAVPVSSGIWAIAWAAATCIQMSAVLLLLYFGTDFGRKVRRRWQ